jgi:hypothetical protein
MTSKLERRVAALEGQPKANCSGRWHRFIVPEGLGGAEREAWQAARMADIPAGDHAVFRVVVTPPYGSSTSVTA